MRFDGFVAMLKRFRVLRAAALALPIAVGFAAPATAAAVPTIVEGRTVNAPAGVRIGVDAEGSFDNAGTNPQITDAVFTASEYHSVLEVVSGRLFVRAKTNAELNALPLPPPNPFTIDVTVTMANDEGQTASGTITFSTTYDRTVGLTLSPPIAPAATPTFSHSGTVTASPGATLTYSVGELFDNAGTNGHERQIHGYWVQ